ncbi:MFS general substrate transporter [Ganoderma sinense ZZ0214-1]|uniref:MFS general substrate transporter n=1 Tax=Ganoderma sinense ZZ0214-1 TaxID=1077348 RepID=A0A2G8SM69_9APHY|nr:MFS general substrate transporter [Ganoderma sinense ZZ0214-1]
MANLPSSVLTRVSEVKNASTISSVAEDGSTFENPAITDRGLKAWLCVFGGALMLFCSGQITAFGIFETYYAQHQLRGVSSSTISWIGSLQLWVLYFSGSILGRIFDAYGPRVILIPGSILLVFSTMITSLCTELYQFLLVQGLLTGLAYGMLFYPSFASISTHFIKLRATAMGITIAGSGVGGVVFPILFRFLFDRIGFGWSVRVYGFLVLVLCTIANATITSRIRPGGNSVPPLPDAKILRDAPFLLLVAGCFFVNFGLFIPFTYISNYAISRGVSSSTSFYIVSAMNAGSIVGRIVPAFLADVVGRFNIASPAAFLIGLLALVFWTFAKSLIPIVVFGVMYGCFAGAFLAMQIPCVSQISDIKEVGTRIGILYSVASFAVLAGGPAAGAVMKADGGSYTGMMALCGILNIVGSLLIFWSKCKVNRNMLAHV